MYNILFQDLNHVRATTPIRRRSPTPLDRHRSRQETYRTFLEPVLTRLHCKKSKHSTGFKNKYLESKLFHFKSKIFISNQNCFITVGMKQFCFIIELICVLKPVFVTNMFYTLSWFLRVYTLKNASLNFPYNKIQCILLQKSSDAEMYTVYTPKTSFQIAKCSKNHEKSSKISFFFFFF